jgi:hypothetical protein
VERVKRMSGREKRRRGEWRAEEGRLRERVG